MKKFILPVVVSVLVSLFMVYLQAAAFNGPSQTPPSGNGVLAAGTSNNASLGNSTPSSSVTLLIVGSTTNSSAYGLAVLNSAQTTLLSVRNDGVVSVGTSTISGGSFAGTVSAGNISSGQFGSNTGGGNYSFSGNLGIGTSTPGSYLTIRSATPLGSMLDVYPGGTGYQGNSIASIVGSIQNGTFTDVMGFTRTKATLTVGSNGANSDGVLNVYSGSENGLLFVQANGNVGIGTVQPSSTFQVLGASSTVTIGTASLPGCLEMGNSNGSVGLNYITVLNGVLSATTTKPSACQ